MPMMSAVFASEMPMLTAHRGRSTPRPARIAPMRAAPEPSFTSTPLNRHSVRASPADSRAGGAAPAVAATDSSSCGSPAVAGAALRRSAVRLRRTTSIGSGSTRSVTAAARHATMWITNADCEAPVRWITPAARNGPTK